MISGYRATPKDLGITPASDIEGLANLTDAAFKATIGVGGALWKYATFGFGDAAIQQISQRVAKNKLRRMIENDGFSIEESKGLWNITKPDGTRMESLDPNRMAQMSSAKNLAEILLRWSTVPKPRGVMSPNDKLVYNIGGALGTFTSLRQPLARVTRGLAARPGGIIAGETLSVGGAGLGTDVIKQLEQGLSEKKPFSFKQAAKAGAWSSFFGFTVGSIQEGAMVWRMHKFLQSDAGIKVIAQKLTPREKWVFAKMSQHGARAEDVRDAKSLLATIRRAEEQGMSVKGAPPKRALEWVITQPREDPVQFLKANKPYLDSIARKMDIAIEKSGWKAPTIMDLPASVVEQKPSPPPKPSTGVITNVGYHAGDLGKAVDTDLYRMDLGRGTGHFGTGTYFVSSPEKTGAGAREGRPVHEVDLSKYNLFKPKSTPEAYALHDTLKAVNEAALSSEPVDTAARRIAIRLSNITDMPVDQAEKAVSNAITSVRSELGGAPNWKMKRGLDSASTRVMKSLGYEGVDVRHLKDEAGLASPDNTAYGTVVYDLKALEPAKASTGGAPEPPSTPDQPGEHPIIHGYRGTTGDLGFGGSEGKGLYVARDPDTASFFGEVNDVYYKEPKNPLIVYEEPLPLLHEDFDIFAPIKKSDSKWIRLNKQAVINAGLKEGGTWDMDAASEELTKLLKKEGHDAVRVTSGGQSWDVLLDKHLIVKDESFHPIIVRPSSELSSILKREPTIRESLYHKKATEAAAKAALARDSLTDDDYLRMAQAEYPHLSLDKQRLAAEHLKKQIGINMRDLSRRTAAEAMLSTEHINQSKGFVNPETRSGSRTLFHERSSRPLALLEQMEDYRSDNMLAENLFWLPSRGRDAQYQFKMDAEDLVREWLKRSGWTNERLDGFSPAIALNPVLAQKHPFKLSSGKVINAYDGTLMDIVMQSTHGSNLKAAINSPFYLGNKKYPPLTKKDIENAYRILVDRYGIERIQALRDIAFEVGQRGKQFGNAASRRVHGYNVFAVKSYWPIMRAEHPPRFGGRRYRELRHVIEESGFAQERKEYSNLPIILGDYFGKLHRTINNMSVYGGMLEPATRAKLMMGDRALRDSIRNKFGPDALDVMDSYVQDMEDISKYHSPITGFLAKRMHKAVLSAIGAHAIVAPKQIISGLYLLNYTDIGTFLDVLTNMRMEEAMRLHRLYCPQVVSRYRDTRIGRDIYVRANARKAFTNRETIEGSFMLAIRGMDKEVVARQAAGIAVAELAKQGIKEGDSRFPEAFNRLVTRMISESQPAWDSLYRSEIGRSRDPLTRVLTLFHSQREAIMSMTSDAAHKYRVTGSIDPILKTGSLVATTAVMYATINALAKKYVYGKKDYSWKDFLAEEIPINLLSIPFFGEIAAYMYTNVERGLRGKPVFQTEPMDFIIAAPIEHATKAVVYTIQAAREYAGEEVEKGEWKWRKTALRASDEIIQAIAPWYGLPIFPYRAGRALIRQATAEPEKEKPIKP